MFDVTLIKQGLSGLVGFRQPANPKYAILQGANLLSKSGLFINDNPYAKIEYVKDNFDYAKVTNEQFNQALTNIRETSAVNICSQIFIEDDFIDRNLIYSNTQNKIEQLPLPNGFVGYRIDLEGANNVAIVINKGLFEFVTGGTINLLVFDTNKKLPIQSIPITFSSFYESKTIDITLNNVGFYKSTFIIGFISDGSLSTYKRNYNDANTMNSISQISIRNIFVPNHNVAELFDLNKIENNNNDYCGFNLDITIVEDYTDFILTNAKLFARVIYLDAIISCLNIYAASLRSNANERNADELYSRIMLEIEGTRPDDNVIHIRGLRPQMVYEISQIREQLLKLKGGFFGSGYFTDTQD
jgi:hypothetical protein